jgi:outer membrane lipoprotein carrier protein
VLEILPFLFQMIQPIPQDAAPKASPPSAPAAAPAPQLTADALVANIQKFYVGTQKLRADFKQTYTNTVFGKSSTSTGKVYVLKPGKMRWDYATPEKKHFISDGTTLWVYEPLNRQAYKQDLKNTVLPVAVTFLYGQGDLSKDFTAKLDPGKYGVKGDLVVKLTPKQPSAQYKNLWLVVDAGDYHVKESIVLEASDNLNQFRFFNFKSNAQAPFQAKHFLFVPPAGTKVITPQQQP